MKAKFERGIVVGKFSPLHVGHEALITFAAEQCRELVLLSYSNPEFEGCEGQQRATWLAERFPAARRIVLDPARSPVPPNDAPDEIQRAFVAKVLHDQGVGWVDAVFTSEPYGEGFAASLEWRQREVEPAAPSVRHVSFDPARALHPVSGTAVRAAPQRALEVLSLAARADFVPRVAFLGGESSGKSTLAQEVSEALDEPFVPEYGRELWEARDGKLSYPDLVDIATEQVRREQAAARKARRYVLCDTTPLTTLFYARAMFGAGDERLEKLASRSYAFTFLCANDFPFVQDGTRRDAGFRDHGFSWAQAELERRHVFFAVVRGTRSQRLGQVLAALGSEGRPG